MLGNLVAAGTSLIGGLFGQKSQEKTAEKNIQLQKDFAQQGIQWKVADAKAAGIHPLYALGAQTHSFSPVSVGDSLSPALANAGQDIGRAINSTSDGSTRVSAIAKAAEALALEKAGLENELLRSQIRRNNSAGTPPPVPLPGTKWLIPGQGETTIPDVPGTILDKPLERSGVDPSRGYSEVGAIPDVGYSNSAPGYYWPVPSEDIKRRIEDNLPAELAHTFRTVIMPAFGQNMQPPAFMRQGGGRIVGFHPFLGYHYKPDPRYSGTTAGRYSPGRKLWRD